MLRPSAGYEAGELLPDPALSRSPDGLSLCGFERSGKSATHGTLFDNGEHFRRKLRTFSCMVNFTWLGAVVDG
jgi:hypothetical protein